MYNISFDRKKGNNTKPDYYWHLLLYWCDMVIKILQIGKYFYPVKGGMENYLYEITNSLKNMYDLSVLVFNIKNTTETEYVNGIKVIRAARLCNLFSTPLSTAMLKYIKEFNGDIIHLHLPNPVASMLYLKAKSKAKLVVSYQYDITKQKILGILYYPFLHMVLRKADKIIVTAENNLIYSPTLKKYATKCVVIPPGINSKKFEITEEVISQAQEIRKKYPGKIVLFVGRLTYYKGVQYLIQASKNQDFTVLLIGSGDEEQNLRKLAKDSLNIHFLTDIEDLRPYYYASDVFVLPSIAR